jgi:membrane protein required for colicin V production
MHWFDIGLTIALMLSVVWGCYRGLVRELFTLVGLAAATVLAIRAYPAAAHLLEPLITTPWVRQAAGFCLIFLAVMVVVMVCSTLLRLFLHAAGLSLVDRLLGGLFGLTRVVLVTTVLLMLANRFVPSARAQLEAESVLAPFMWRSAEYLEAFVAQHVSTQWFVLSGQ